MLKHVFVMGLAVVGIMLASPCHGQFIDPNADVMYHLADANNPTTEAFLDTQIMGVKATVVGAYALPWISSIRTTSTQTPTSRLTIFGASCST